MGAREVEIALRQKRWAEHLERYNDDIVLPADYERGKLAAADELYDALVNYLARKRLGHNDGDERLAAAIDRYEEAVSNA